MKLTKDEMADAFWDAASKFEYILRWRWHFAKLSTIHSMIHYMNEMGDRHAYPDE